METRVNVANWAELDFLINNFYEIVEFKRGRGIYGDRVILQRPKRAECIFGERDRLFEFYYLNANAVKELPRTMLEKINIVKRIVVNPESVNLLCDFSGYEQAPIDWSTKTAIEFSALKTLDFSKLNNLLLNRYKLLGPEFLSKLNKHRERQYYLASRDELNLISKEYANEQLNKF